MAVKRFICRIIGHDRVSVRSQYWSRRNWRWCDGSRFHCARCGMGEPDVWEQMWLERQVWSVRQWWWGLLAKCEAMDRPDPPKNPADDDLPF